MESETKRIKLDPVSELQLLDLDDDGILANFERLTMDELSSMNFNCERIQKLAFKHFLRKFPDEMVTIHPQKIEGLNTFVFPFSNEKYMKYFRKCIPTVHLIKVVSHVRQLFEFVKAQCCPNLKTLDITATVCIFAKDGQIIKDQLGTLERLAVRNMSQRTDIYNVFLKHCPNLKHLTIDTNNYWNAKVTNENWNTKWLQHRYPNLKSLVLLLDKNQCTKFLQSDALFFQNNPQISDISCVGGDILKTVLVNVNNIERLAIHIRCDDRLADIIDDLKSFCKQHPVICLAFDVTLSVSAMRELNLIHDLSGSGQPIHGLSIRFDPKCELILNEMSMSTIMDLKYLTKLNIHVSYWATENRLCGADKNQKDQNLISHFTNIIAQKMIHLEELELSLLYNDPIFIEKTLMPFVCHTAKMRKLRICVHDCENIILSGDVFEHMNVARSELLGAGSLRIHIIHNYPTGDGKHRRKIEQRFDIPLNNAIRKTITLIP